jgi:16S rRNA (cytidine1402-2'-O)-methyltransferase
MSGTLYIVATPIGNLEDITLRAKRILSEVDLIAAEDTRHTRKLLSHLDIHTPMMSFSQHHERGKIPKVLDALKDGKDVALVSDAGTPCISDPGYPLLVAAIGEGIDVVPVPGASAAITALSAAGLPTDKFTFIGFLPEKPGKRRKVLEGLADYDHTLVFYVSKWKVEKQISEMLEIFGDRRACLCRELTKVHEEFVRGTLGSLLDVKNPKGELVLVIGPCHPCESRDLDSR